MKIGKLCFILAFSAINALYSDEFRPIKCDTGINYIDALKDTLLNLAADSDEAFFKMHCSSIVSVIESKKTLTSADSVFLENTYNAFTNILDTANPKNFSTYIQRERSLILSWISPTDGTVSFSWLKLPKNWDPETTYPVYIQLHGLWSVADNPVEYLTYPFRVNPSAHFSFEDGYLLSPWGRGNLWYQGISEIDIWECLSTLQGIANIDPARKYLSGHSMGGYGAWRIAGKSPGVWAAIGIHAGALWYDNANLVNSDVAYVLRDVPTYFVCGTIDGLLAINQDAYNLLESEGNQNIQFVTFNGGHEYLEENVENMYLWMHGFINQNVQSDMESYHLVNQKLQVTCYPDPASSYIYIKYYLHQPSICIFEIYDLSGQVITKWTEYKDRPGEYLVNYNLSSLSDGTYILRLKTDYGEVQTKMMVLK